MKLKVRIIKPEPMIEVTFPTPEGGEAAYKLTVQIVRDLIIDLNRKIEEAIS